MSRENPWTKHRQSFWEEKVGKPELPLWLRITAVAYSGHRRNGHTPLGVGDLALALMVIADPETGEIRTPGRSNISRAISTAVAYGFLHADSNIRCLVVPPWGIEGGTSGRQDEECPCHSVVRKPQKRATQGNAVCHSVVRPDALTCENVTPLYDSSNPGPPGPEQPQTKEAS